MSRSSQRGALAALTGGFVVLVLIALIGFSVSVRAKQVEHALHGSRISPVHAKVDVSLAVSFDYEPQQDSTFKVPPAPQTAGFPFGDARTEPNVAPQPVMYSVAVHRRPPPFFS